MPPDDLSGNLYDEANRAEKRPTTFHDIEATKYPFSIRAYNYAGVVVWSETVAEPCALDIPPLARQHGTVWVEIEYADGTKEDYGAPTG